MSNQNHNQKPAMEFTMKKAALLMTIFLLVCTACTTDQAALQPTEMAAPTAVPTSAPTLAITASPDPVKAAVAAAVAAGNLTAAARPSATPDLTKDAIATWKAGIVTAEAEWKLTATAAIPPTPYPSWTGPAYDLAIAYLTAYSENRLPFAPAVIDPSAEYMFTDEYGDEGVCARYLSAVGAYSVDWYLCANLKAPDYDPALVMTGLAKDWTKLESGLEYGEHGALNLIAEPDGSNFIAWLPFGDNNLSVQANFDPPVSGPLQEFYDENLLEPFDRLFHRMFADAGVAVQGVYFADDFSHPRGWWIIDEPLYTSAYENDGYSMFFGEPDQVLIHTPNVAGQVQDVSVSAEITQLEGDYNEVFYGVVCRYQDLNNFYMFRINGYGSYSVAKIVDNNFAYFGDQNWFYDPAPMNPPGEVNVLRADCIGDTLTFYINGVKVTEVTDSDLSEGSYGVVLGTMKTDRVKALYDNFLVKAP